MSSSRRRGVTVWFIEPMAGRERNIPVVDADAGTFSGRSVARRFVSPDGLVVLVGRSAEDNDVLTFRLASPNDFWMHVAAESGSHVVVRNPDRLSALPRATMRFAAALAVRHSRARHGGRVVVHVARRGDVSKPRGFAAGKVALRRYDTVRARAEDAAESESPTKDGA